MDRIIVADGLKKTFYLSKKQQRLEHTKETRRVAVDGLSFEAYRGEVFGLLGPNGAGKTTTLRMLATLIKPDEGDALIDGASIRTAPADVRARIGFLTSELKLEDFLRQMHYTTFSPNCTACRRMCGAPVRSGCSRALASTRSRRSGWANCPPA